MESSGGDSNTSNDESPFAREENDTLIRHNINIYERIHSASDDHGDDDASMSNDESMSSGENQNGSDFEQQYQVSPKVECTELSDPTAMATFPRQLPCQVYDTKKFATNIHLSTLRTTNFAFDYVDTSINGPIISPIHPPMWLLAQFAPAMSKTMKSIDSSVEMEDEELFLSEEMAKNHEKPSPGNEKSEKKHFVHQVENQRVQWALASAHVELLESVRLISARNEVTGIQLRLHSNVPFLLTTDTSNWMLSSGHGPRARVAIDTRFIPLDEFKIETFVVGCVLDENSNLVMETLQRTGVSSKAVREHAVYLRIRVGEKLEPGIYEIPLRVFTQEAGFSDEQLTWSSSVAVNVVDVQLPTPSNWRFRLDLWQHWTALARAHHVSLWSNGHFELIDRYMALLSEIGQKCLSVVATEMPWAGQQCYMEEQNASALFEHAILEVYEDPAHGVPVSIDFTHFDRLLALGARHHVDHEIEVFGLLSVWRDPVAGFDAPAELTTDHLRPLPTVSAPESAPAPKMHRRTPLIGSRVTSSTATSSSGMQNPGDLDHEHSQSSSLPPSPATASSEAPAFVVDGWRIRCQDRTTQCVRYLRRVSEVETFIEQFYAHCIALEIADRVRICADEPREVAVFHEQLRFLQRLAPNFRIKLAVNHSEFFSPAYAPPQVADYVPLLPLACADLEVTRRLAKDARARGGHVCWYVCCGPAFPNQFVSSPLVEGELVGYLTFFFELDGFLRWNYCLWPSRPWDDLRWRASMWKVGDMYFVLPGQDGWPVETLRLESLRFAGQAFELLRLAQETLAPAQMQQLQRTVAEQILRSSDLEEFGRYANRAREDLYSLDPLDYQRAKTIILNTLAAAAVKEGSGA